MKIAFASIFDPTDPLVWSGTENRILQGLIDRGHTVHTFGNLFHGRSLSRFCRKYSAQAIRKHHLHFWDNATALDFSRDLTVKIEKIKGVDCVVSPSPVPVAFLDKSHRVYVWTDATFTGLSQYHREFMPGLISRSSHRHASKIDSLNVLRQTNFVLTSDWSARSITTLFPDARVNVIPFGANYDVNSERSLEPTQTIVLTFLAVRWQEKGGDKAFAVFSRLLGIYSNVELHIVGCTPPDHVANHPNVKLWGFVNKFTESGRQLFETIMWATDYVIVPTEAEAYGMFAAEAAAFGKVVLTHNVGGLSTVVVNEETGFTFHIDESVDVWVNTVNRLQGDLKLKAKIGKSARLRYKSLLNWDTAMKSFTQLIESTLT
jgi:starch synthase